MTGLFHVPLRVMESLGSEYQGRILATRTRVDNGSAAVAVQWGTSVGRVHDVIRCRNMTE
ncbi:hypothetical protein CY34DRAFT_647835 [Suillus luteus UH-Slu-Lm8-n1]|uniref:Uncharacterized protein n=1 Tax=Suillus luteus UH-Slu-Lm8-n1 TaxID=930992 RepID=A0A0D0BLN2_9AGAM|nr:hypothetical protein CY34DRAFT_647835 [Suillus luteus UH-Slu-Lm8-n1]